MTSSQLLSVFATLDTASQDLKKAVDEAGKAAPIPTYNKQILQTLVTTQRTILHLLQVLDGQEIV